MAGWNMVGLNPTRERGIGRNASRRDGFDHLASPFGSRARRRRGTGIALFVAACALSLVAGACAPEPAPPPNPKVAVQLSLTDDAVSVVGIVRADAVPKHFPGEGNFEAEWTYRDLTTGSIVYTTTEGTGGFDGTLTKLIQAGLFDVQLAGSTASANVEVTVTITRDGATATGSDSKVLSWTSPTSPVSGSIAPTSGYTVLDNTYTTCSPVGTEIHVNISGATSDAYAGFVDLTTGVGFGPLVPFDSSDSMTLVTTDPCWSVFVARASFRGDLSGTMNYTIDWLPGLDPMRG